MTISLVETTEIWIVERDVLGTKAQRLLSERDYVLVDEVSKSNLSNPREEERCACKYVGILLARRQTGCLSHRSVREYIIELVNILEVVTRQ